MNTPAQQEHPLPLWRLDSSTGPAKPNSRGEASWIGYIPLGGPRTVPPALHYRREFVLDAPLPRAALHITALGLFECEINGQRVGEDVFAPGWTDYRKRVHYHTYDVRKFLRPGKNVIGVILGDGWYSGHVAERDRGFYGDCPALLAAIVDMDNPNRPPLVATDAEWRCAHGPILENDLIMGETYDARRELGAWSSPDYAAGPDWLPVRIMEAPAIAIERSPGPPVRRQEILPGKLMDGTPDVRWLPPRRRFDFGQNFSGRLSVRVRGPRGMNLQIRHAEMLKPDGSLFTENLRTARATDHYTLRGDGSMEEWEPRFTFHGFRYAELLWHRGEEPLHIESVEGVVLHSDMARTGHFECSNPLLNQLASNILWGQKSNFLEVPTDCPQRDERLGWTGDAQVFARTAAFFMDVRKFFHKWLGDMRDSQGPDGAVPQTAPNTESFGGGKDGGSGWADATFICPWTIYRCYGDTDILREHYSSMVGYFDYLQANKVKDDIRCHPDVDSWGGFGDWLALDGSGRVWGATPKDLIGTAYYAKAADILSKTADLLGLADDAARHRKEHDRIVRAFQERFVKPDGKIAGEKQTSYAIALDFGLVPENLRPAAAKELARLVEENGCHLTTGFLGTPCILPALEANGYIDLAYRLLEQETFPSWLFPVKNGATTIWECWDGWTPEKGLGNAGMCSFNHYAYGAVGAWMVSAVAGLEIAEPGYQRILFKPRPGGSITRASANLETPHGRAAISWRIKEDNILFLQLEVPPDSRATLDLPVQCDQPPMDIREGRHELEFSFHKDR